jgi:TRAP-type C4-dicarboxylate transport system permease large subunit
MVIAVIIGQVTPPTLIALVIGGGRLADVDQLRVFRANWPFSWGMVAFVLLIMLVPELALDGRVFAPSR